MQTSTTSKDFNQNPSAIKKSADKGPVIITERGKPAYVMIRYGDFCTLTQGHKSVLDSLYMIGAEDIDFDPVRDTTTAREVDF